MPFLLLAPLCVLLGASMVSYMGRPVDILTVVLALIAALAAQVAVNTLNEYTDYKSGLDLKTRRTAFSGGSGALPANPAGAEAVLHAGWAALLVLLAVGAYFAWVQGWQIVPLGVAGILLILFYTGWVNRHPLVCLIAPGLGFGLFMVVGTVFVLTGEYSIDAVLAGLVPFFMINNLLLLNQYPDIDADRSVGRRHVPIAYGVRIATIFYLLFILAAAGTIIFATLTGHFPILSHAAMTPMLLALVACSGAFRLGRNIAQVPVYLLTNVAATLLSILFLAAALFIS